MRRLIINADDFGLTPGVNRGIVEAHDAGVVTSATLMAGGGSFEEAVRLARARPKLSVGCHIVLLDGTPLVPGIQVSSLIEKDGDAPQFRTSPFAFAVATMRRMIDPRHVEAEAVAQIRKLQSAGIAVSHIDTHKHAHMFPAVLKPLLNAALACGIRALRNPFVTSRRWVGQLRHRPALAKRFLQVQMLRTAFSNQFAREVRRAGLATPDGSFGIVETGYLDSFLLQAIVDAIPDGTWELVCHPGYEDAELARVNTRLRISRVEELELLSSPATRELLAQRGVQLISYRDLATGMAR